MRLPRNGSINGVMSMSDPLEVTPEEAQAGFVKVYLADPKSTFLGHGTIEPAVVKRLGPCDIILKIRNPANVTEYSHRKFGTYQIGELDPEWIPVLTPIPEIQLALSSAISGKDQRVPGAVIVHISTPEIELRCPSCSVDFELNVDHLPFGGQHTCPNCNHVGDTGSFSVVD